MTIYLSFERFVLFLLIVEGMTLGYIGLTVELTTRLVLVSWFMLVACSLAFAFGGWRGAKT